VTPAELTALADELRALHRAPELLVLPNAWDAASARLFAGELGFPAVATTSAGVAEALGYADHQATPPEEMFAAVGRIASAVEVPVTADLEAGYWLSATDLVGSLLDAGGVGMNIEDTDHREDRIVSTDEQVERIASIKAAGREAGVDVVVNARIDEFLRGERSVDEGLARARAYAAAGADSVYPIGVRDEETISAFVDAVDVAVNVLMRPGVPSLARLQELGVGRVTWGSGIFNESLRAARELLRGAS
jgi:2-methylisocitrate lyase-like PEP mutase family enzyme